MSKQNFKHSSLTHFMRRNGDPRAVFSILMRCDVSPRVGGLPPQLVPLVRPENRAKVTDAFGRCLEQFFVDNRSKITALNSDMKFKAPDISALFGTECVITARGVSVFGVCPWSGGFGVVCKVSFPKIHADYALKYFLVSDICDEHGAYFEIPTAFAANRAEPRDNCPIYMASFKLEREFMLSKWGGDVADGNVRPNKYEIYATSAKESDKRNWRGGRRIDYGETSKTDYGALSYSERKMFRKILRVATMGYSGEFEYMYNTASDDKARQNLKRLVHLAHRAMFLCENYNAMDVIERCMQSHRR